MRNLGNRVECREQSRIINSWYSNSSAEAFQILDLRFEHETLLC